jgi:hypothetical protein
LALTYFLSKILRLHTSTGEDATDKDCVDFRKENLENNQAAELVASTLYTNDLYLAAVMKQYSPKFILYILPKIQQQEVKTCLKNMHEMMKDSSVLLDAKCRTLKYLQEMITEEIIFTESYKSAAAADYLYASKPMYRACMHKKNGSTRGLITDAVGQLFTHVLNVFGIEDIFNWMRWLENSETKNTTVLIWLCIMVLSFYMGDMSVMGHMMVVYLVATSGFKLELGTGFFLSLIDGVVIIIACKQDWVRGLGGFRLQ